MASRVIVTNTKMLTGLYGTTEIKSIDYNSVKALANARSTRSWGSSSFALSVPWDGTATTGYALAWSALVRGAGRRPGNQHVCGPPAGQNNALAVMADMSIGAARIEDEGVVEIACA